MNEKKFTPLGEETNNSAEENFNDMFGEFTESDSNENEHGDDSLFSGADIEDFVKQGIEQKKSEAAYSKFSKIFGYSESSVIKKEDLDENLIITQNDLEALLKLEDDDRKKTKFETIIQSDDDTEEEYLQEKFKDFIVYPKITGSSDIVPDHNLIPGEYIENSDRQVEITDDPETIEDEHRTSIEIDRDENGDIESITVFCKCGERTFIKFDFDDTDDDETSLLQSQAKVSSFKIEEIHIDKSRQKK